MTRKTCSTFSMRTCSNSLILNKSLSIKCVHLSGMRSSRTPRGTALSRDSPVSAASATGNVSLITVDQNGKAFSAPVEASRSKEGYRIGLSLSACPSDGLTLRVKVKELEHAGIEKPIKFLGSCSWRWPHQFTTSARGVAIHQNVFRGHYAAQR